MKNLGKNRSISRLLGLAGVLSILFISCPIGILDETDLVTDDDQNGDPTAPLAVVFVSSLGNDENPGGEDSAPKATLSAAIEAVADGGEIRVAEGTYNENLVIAKSVTIRGSFDTSFHSSNIEESPSVIDGNESASVIVATDCDLQLYSLILQNGGDDTGGGISQSGGTLFVASSKIVNNEATRYSGGGINLHGVTAEIENTEFYANRAPHSEDGWGGGLNGWESTIDIRSCSFIGNQAGAWGGAISVGPNEYVVTVAHTNYEVNTPNDVNGAIVEGSIAYTSIEPTSGAPYDRAVLTGSGFGVEGGVYTLMVAGTTSGGTAVRDELIESWTDTEIVFQIPNVASQSSDGLGDYYIQLIRSSDGPDNRAGIYPVFTVDGVFETPVFTATSVTPEIAAAGDRVTISGSGFGPVPGTTWIAGESCLVTTWSDSEITFVVSDAVSPTISSDAISTTSVFTSTDTGLRLSIRPPAPQVTGTVAGEVTFTGAPIRYASVYELVRSNSLDGAYDVVASASSPALTDTTAAARTSYYYAYRGTNNSGSLVGPIGTAIAVTVGEADTPATPPTPADVALQSVTASTATLSWTGSGDATTYRVYRAADMVGPYVLIDTATNPPFEDTGLDASTTYYYTVSASNGGGESPQSTPVEATTLAEAPSVPDTPTDLQVTDTTATTVSLQWQSVAGATSYTVYRSTDYSGPYEEIDGTMSTTYDDSGLASQTTYYYAVSALNSAGEGPMTSSQEATTEADQPVTPDTPTGLHSTGVSATSVTLQWSSVSGATTYVVYRSTGYTGNYARIATTTGTSHTDSNLSSQTYYYYRVTASSSDGESAQSDPLTTQTSVPPPSTPTGFSAISMDASSIQLMWNAVNGATSYKVYRYNSSSSAFVLIDTTTTTTYSDSGLSSSTAYQYKVSAINSAGEGPVTSYQEATTAAGYLSDNAGPVESGTYVLATSGGSVTHTFNAATGAASYSVAGYTYAGTYAYNASTGALNLNLSRSESTSTAGITITTTTNMSLSYNCAFTTNNGDYLYLGAVEQTAGTIGELPGSYFSAINQTMAVSVSSPYGTSTQTVTTNTSSTTTFNANGSFSSVAQVSGTNPSSSTTSGTWAENDGGTITQHTTSPSDVTTTFTPYWVEAFGATWLAASNGGYLRQ